jgi:hypothetical protein
VDAHTPNNQKEDIQKTDDSCFLGQGRIADHEIHAARDLNKVRSLF